MTPGLLLWQVTIRWRVAMDRVLAPHGLTNASYGVLAALHALSRDGGQPSQRALATFSGLEPMFVSKLARSLERAGLIERTVDPDDSRALRLIITEQGTEMIVAAAADVRRLHDDLLQPLGGLAGPRSRRLTAMLGELHTHASEYLRTALPSAAPSG